MSIMDGFASIGRAIADLFTSRVEDPCRYKLGTPAFHEYAEMLYNIRKEQERRLYGYLGAEPQTIEPESFCGVCGSTRYSSSDGRSRIAVGPTEKCDHCTDWLRGAS